MTTIIIQAVSVFLPLGYLMTLMLYAMAFAGQRAPRVARVRPHMLKTLLVLHLGQFILHGIEAGGLPIFDAWLSLSAVALALAGLFGIVIRRHDQATVGALVLFVAALLQLISSMFGPMQAIALEGPSDTGTFIHVVTAAAACAALILSGLYGFLYLTLLRQMKNQSFGPIFRQLPDLTQLARMTRRAALAGFISLTLGVNVGIGVAHAKGTAGFLYTDPLVILAFALWLHFGIIAFSGKVRGLTAQRASFAAVAGLTVVVATLFLTAVPGFTFHTFR